MNDIQNNYKALDPQTKCSICISPLVDGRFAILIDGKDQQVMREQELLAATQPPKSAPSPLMYAAFELLRQHVISDAHTDESYVELAAR